MTGQDKDDFSQVPAQPLVTAAVVLDFSEQAAAGPDWALEREHIARWEAAHGSLPEGGWMLLRTGWAARPHDQTESLNATETGPHTSGILVDCARWLADEAPIIGVGVETVGTDAGGAHSFDPASPSTSS